MSVEYKNSLLINELNNEGGGKSSSGKRWRASLVDRLIGKLSSLILAIFLLTFHVFSYADNNELLKGQILWVACNGDVTDQSG
ncbi:MAG: hypothetical protein BWK79_08025, partial [Beggiatoa sp. IS2]